jgi:hypothetical protein
MHSKTVIAVSIVTLVILSSCATPKIVTRETFYSPDSRKRQIGETPVDPSSIRIFQKKPDQLEIVEVGEIIVENARDWEEARGLLKLKAAEMGGNAAYIYKTEYHGRRGVHGFGFYFGYHYHPYVHSYSYRHSHRYMYYHRHHHRHYFPDFLFGYGYDEPDRYGYPYLSVTAIVIRVEEL